MTGPGVTPQTSPNAANVLLGLEYPANEYEYNGNIKGANRYWRPSNGGTLDTMTNTYAYDNLNRLTSYNFNAIGANTLSGVYNYSMDEFGNLLEQVKQSGSGEAPMGHANPVDRNTNRLTGADIAYDILGNQVKVMQSAPGSPASVLNLIYLDQGHVYEVKDSGNALQYRYYYDAEGKRRAKAKVVSGAVSLADNCSFFFYSGEDLICQKDLGAEVVPDSDAPDKVNGAYYQPKFLLTDHLGTTRAELMFDAATLQPKLAKTYDTMPYGELISVPTGRAEPVLFSGKPRDTESGLDYFGARYLSSTQFSFVSPDNPKFSEKTDPQTWNLYSYTSNNPVCRIDLLGCNWFNIDGKWKWYKGDTYTYEKDGKTQTVTSKYTHLLVFYKLGNRFGKDGAMQGTLALYGNAAPKGGPIAMSTAFSGASLWNLKVMPNGDYEINLNKRGGKNTNYIVETDEGPGLGAFHGGIQEVSNSVPYKGQKWDCTLGWGDYRANFTTLDGEGTSYYLHGKNNYYLKNSVGTHGCITEPEQTVLKAIFRLDPSGVGEGEKNGKIAVWVTQKTK